MINKTDLRIGNSVMLIDRSNAVHLPIEKPFAIVELKIFTVELAPLGIPLHKVENFIEASYADLDPIPITEEALVNMGFEKQMSWTYCIQIKGNEKLIYYLGEKGWSIGNKNYSDFECRFIHQLQNLYYFLCGTELEFG